MCVIPNKYTYKGAYTMNGITQEQQQNGLQIAGLIENFRTIKTRTGKPMARFNLGTTPVKCFDSTVERSSSPADADTAFVS